jgi:hypothetical protein
MTDKMQRLTGDVSIKRYFDTDYIGAYSLDDGAEPIVTIDSMWYGELTLAGGRKENHVVLKFKEKSVPGCDEVKPMILNSTNRKALKKAYGNDTPATLEGKRIQLYIDPKVRDPQDGGWTEGLRIRPRIPKESGPATCGECGEKIVAAGNMNAAQVLAYAQHRFKANLCAACMKKREEAKKAPDPEPVAPVEAEPEQTEMSEFERAMREGQE